MAPVTPHWQQPSHPEIQQVIINEAEFTTKSLSRVALPPFALFSRLDFPPCTEAPKPTYATVQMGRNRHFNLNSDLLYINHSCEPSLIFDPGNKIIIAGPSGLKPGDELTFFYPSTEWEMAQPFRCLCGTPTCRGTIDGARKMTAAQLDGLWLSKHIRELRAELADAPSPASSSAATGAAEADPTAQALQHAVEQAERVVEAARSALVSYVGRQSSLASSGHGATDGKTLGSGGGGGGGKNGLDRRGPTSRELSGEMGGDTAIRA